MLVSSLLDDLKVGESYYDMRRKAEDGVVEARDKSLKLGLPSGGTLKKISVLGIRN